MLLLTRAVTRSAAGALGASEASGQRPQGDQGHQSHIECRRACLGGRLYRLGRAEQENRGDGDSGLGRNLIESHAMEGAPMNAIDTALLKAKSACVGGAPPRRPTDGPERRELAPTFMHDFHNRARFLSWSTASHWRDRRVEWGR